MTRNCDLLKLNPYSFYSNTLISELVHLHSAKKIDTKGALDLVAHTIHTLWRPCLKPELKLQHMQPLGPILQLFSLAKHKSYENCQQKHWYRATKELRLLSDLPFHLTTNPNSSTLWLLSPWSFWKQHNCDNDLYVFYI